MIMLRIHILGIVTIKQFTIEEHLEYIDFFRTKMIGEIASIEPKVKGRNRIRGFNHDSDNVSNNELVFQCFAAPPRNYKFAIVFG